ncbi:MAG: OadG family protein [Lachnospiraceae bacterium]|nr:OadG family protein [Lachnospiraceae bacterium]
MTNLVILAAVAEDTRSLGEKMSEAGLNTVIGISIVFLALAFISIIIAIEGKIFKAIGSRGKKKQAAPQATEEKASQPVVEEVASAESDDALIAVITAAVYEYELQATGTVPANGLYVRSIRRK